MNLSLLFNGMMRPMFAPSYAIVTADETRKAADAGGDASPYNLGKVWLTRLSARKRPRSFGGVAVAASLICLLGAAGPLGASENPPRVVTTIKPVHSIAAAVLGDISKPELLVDGASSPHNYALKPSDARLLNSADVFVRVSKQVEPFTERVIQALPPAVEVVTLSETEGLRLLPVRSGSDFDPHHHGDGHDHADDDQKNRTNDFDANAADGHVWLDPENAKLIARRLADVFAGRWPQHRESFEANASRFAAEVDAASEGIASDLALVRDVPFVVFHDAYHYFEERFGLEAVGAITINPDVPPGARRISALRQRIQELGGVCVFAEPQFSSRVLDAVAAGTGARSGVLDPIGVDIAPGSDHYTEMLRNLAEGFVTCLRHDPARKGAEQ